MSPTCCPLTTDTSICTLAPLGRPLIPIRVSSRVAPPGHHSPPSCVPSLSRSSTGSPAILTLSLLPSLHVPLSFTLQ
eukprot:4912314-Prorocentrum_lima.AAC.1